MSNAAEETNLKDCEKQANNLNRSSMLVLSSSKEDEDENHLQHQTTSQNAVDPKTLIQFKEVEQDSSFTMSKHGGSNILEMQQISADAALP